MRSGHRWSAGSAAFGLLLWVPKTCATCADPSSGRRHLGPVAGRFWPGRTCGQTWRKNCTGGWSESQRGCSPFRPQPTVLRRRPCLRTSRTGRLILEAARADGRRADPVHPRQRLPMDLASLFPGRPHSAQPRPHVSGHDQERGRRPAQRMRNTAHPHRPRPLHTGRI